MKRLRPLLFKHRVSAYFCGHDHSMQHLREANTTLDYFVVGAGHLTDPSQIHKVKWLEHTSPPATPLSHLSPPPPHADGCSQGLFAFLVRSIGPVGRPWGVCHCQCGSALTQHHLLQRQRWAGRAGHKFLLCIFYLCVHRHGNSNPHRQIAIHVSEHPSTTEHSWTQVMLAQGSSLLLSELLMYVCT